MRKTLILTLVLCVFAVIAYAQTGAAPATSGTSTTTSTTTSSTGAAATTTTKTHKHAASCTFKGTVASADAANKSFVVHPAKGDDVTVKTNDKTKWIPKGKCSWDDIKEGAKVSGTCKKDGADTWALTVHCWPAPKAKAEPAAKTGK
ncbi:MAG TPA: hypothetical protein VJA16_05765 [Thermoanaerobaculia bacterium]